MTVSWILPKYVRLLGHRQMLSQQTTHASCGFALFIQATKSHASDTGGLLWMSAHVACFITGEGVLGLGTLRLL